MGHPRGLGGIRRRRSIRMAAACLALLTFALPGLAAAAGYCCAPAASPAHDCCAASKQLPGMDASGTDASRMDGMNAAPATHVQTHLAAVQCAQAPDNSIAELSDRSERTLDGHHPLLRGERSALARNPAAELAREASLLLSCKRPPGSSRSTALTFVLRI
jgi:hypothetical protein